MSNQQQITVHPLMIAVALLVLSMPAVLGDDLREVELPGPPKAGPGRIPHHHSNATLDQITQLAPRNPFGSASFQICTWIESRQGALVLPPLGFSVGSRGTVLIPPSEVVLANWQKTLPDGFLGHSLRNLATIPIDGVNPLLWQSGRQEEARRQLAKAIERADRATASILLRRADLVEDVNPEILEWIRSAPSITSPWHRTDHLHDFEAPQLLDHQVKAQLPMAQLETRPDTGSFSAYAYRQGLTTRRSPVADFHPLQRDDLVLLASGNRVLAIDTKNSLDVKWTWSLHPELKPNRFPPLIGISQVPISSGDRCVFLLRTGRHFQRPATNIIIEDGPWKDFGWLEAVVLELSTPDQAPVSAWSPPIAQEGFTVAPAPHIDGDRLWLVATRGWSELETWAFAFDIKNQRELWRRKLAVRPPVAHSLNDLRGKVSDASIARRADDLVISRSGGAIELLSASTGEHRATIHQPHWHFSDLPTHSGVHLGSSHFQGYPQIRRRAHSSIEVPSDRSHPWLLLPADGKMLLAVDIQSWSIKWSYAASRETSLLGIVDGTAWLLDSGIEQEDHRITLVGLDAQYGSVRQGPWQIELAARVTESDSNEDEKAAITPLLRGLPRLFKDSLWVPTLVGIETFSLVDGSSTGVTDWPQGTKGGTPLPLQDGRLLLLRRGDIAAKTVSALELLMADQAPGKEH
jgi:hypothetical protein